MRPPRTFPKLSILLAAAVVAAGCSLVNALDEVTPPREATYGAGPKVEEVLPEGGAAAEAGDAGPAAGDHEVLVVAGTVAADGSTADPVLTVLDTANGHEIGKREKMYVAGIAYDSPRDLWYIFEAPSFFIPAPSDVVRLHVRRLDIRTGAWIELSSTVVPSLVYYDGIIPTNSRLTFVAHPAEAGGAFRLVTFDVADPAKPALLDDRDLPLLPLAMMGTRSGGGPGGQVTLMNIGSAGAGDCADAGPQSCATKLRRFLIPNGGAPQDLGTFLYGAMSSFGTPGYGSVICGGGPDELLVLPRNGAGPHEVHLLNYLATTGAQQTTFTMMANATRLRRAAVDNPRRLVFIIEANTDTALYAIPLATNGVTAKAGLRHSGQAVYYDPASETAFAPFNQGNGNTFSAFRVTGTAMNPGLKERTASAVGGDFDPPSDLRPVLLGIREPASFACP